MMKSNYVYIVRLATAFCLFLLLAKANIWVGALSNTVLVLGYRLCILFSPLFLAFGVRGICPVALFIAFLGVLCWYFSLNIVGAFLIAIGLAVGGYTLKLAVAQTSRGAGFNKVALNVGVVLSGLAIALLPFRKADFLILLSLVLFFSLLVCCFSFWRKGRPSPVINNNFSISSFFCLKGLGWALIGIALGVKMIAVFTVLPQYLIEKKHFLPSWYGYIVVVNAVVVVSLQMPLMKLISRLSFCKSLLPLLVAMVIVATSYFQCLDLPVFAFMWVFALSLLECFVTYLDTLAAQDGGLLAKEAFWGVGSALSVLLVRGLNVQLGSELIGVIGFTATILGMVLVMIGKRGEK